ncbi:probable mediator of RNA polymerase II transcription subunit 26b [Magnolia sinica]|uniref:probable mediator of RNA polymerase II transcription subunit 26b n=1 Tax=Magnolia sinica TaxID=86752 RepID=UPI00265B3B44|nr:probable mediator of RNA polymerase II transcription subunit 26b [Magnolia sinica]
MAMKSATLDHWRDYFRGADSDIFEVIEYAIVVAASDCPKEFRMRRDRIAEKLFSCRLTRCFGCDRVELAVPQEDEEEDDDLFDGAGKDSKVNSSTNDHVEPMAQHRRSNYSYDEAEALTEEIEEESQIVGEVLRIKEVLGNHLDEPDSVLFESLRRLQLMELSVETLKATEIGKAVNGLRKHGSKQIRHLARTLIDGWKDLVDAWVNAAAAIAGGTPESVNPSVVDEEEGLPSPPLDEGAFLATQTTSMELSQFFDGMDDDGNPRNSRESDNNHGNGRKPTSDNSNPRRKQKPPEVANVPMEDKIQVRKQEAVIRQNKPMNADVGPGRPPKMSLEHKANGDVKLQQRRDQVGVQRKPLTSLQDKSKHSDDLLVRAKLEATKRRLHEGYQQAENAKKQRTIQVMELHDLPKQGLSHRNPYLKPGNHNRHWSHGRR